MTKQAKIAIFTLFVLVVLYVINNTMQDKYNASDTELISKDREYITRFVIEKESEKLELIKVDTLWTISGHDSLTVKSSILGNFFDDIEGIEREESPISTNPKNWSKYSVDDSSGTHLSLFGLNDTEIGRFVLGRSKTNWGQNAIRINDESPVYLTTKNILHRLQTKPSYWGEIPKPPEEEGSEVTPVSPALPNITIPSDPGGTGS